MLRWLQFEIVAQGTPPSGGLLVSNHLSYLDILVFSATCSCIFIAKREIKSWPVIGWITTLAGTIYLDRTRKSATHSIQDKMMEALQSGVPVVLFPEGTSSDGSRVLPFHSSLFQAAVERRISVRAACINYDLADGNPAVDVCYYGDMVLVPHIVKLFRKGTIRAILRFDEIKQTFNDRKAAASVLRDRVVTLTTI